MAFLSNIFQVCIHGRVSSIRLVGEWGVVQSTYCMWISLNDTKLLDQLIQCREDVAEYSRRIRKVALRLLEAISESLGLERDYIDRALGKHGQHMALNYYPPCPQPELTYGLPGHADPNVITILLQDDVPGLQVLNNDKWLAVNPIPHTFIINIGDQIQVLSNDRYKSVLHRAVVNSYKERISIPTFYCPSPEAVIAPAPKLIDEEHPCQYKSFTYTEYYQKFWNRGLAKETCLDLFRATP